MATHSIGTGGDFSTIQAWEDDIPATLTEQRIGQLQNEEFVSGSASIVDFSAHVTTSSFDIVLECEAGASFADHADVRTNALRYNASNGAGMRTTGTYMPVITVSGAIGHLTVRGVQLKCDGGNNTGAAVYYTGFHAATLHVWKDIIMHAATTNVRVADLRTASEGQIIRCVNVLAVQQHTSGDGILSSAGNNEFIHCTVVRPSDVTAAGTGFVRLYNTPLVTGCAVFGFSTSNSASFSASSSNNATDLASGLPGTDNQHSVTYSQTTPFVDADKDSLDLRLADDANELIDNGLLDATNAPEDISGLTREDPPEIGVWELAAAGAVGNPWYHNLNQMAGHL